VECKFCSRVGVGNLYSGIVLDQLFFGALFVEADVGIAVAL